MDILRNPVAELQMEDSYQEFWNSPLGNNAFNI